MNTKAVEKAIMAKTPLVAPVPDESWLSSGIDLLDIGVSKKRGRCTAKGKYVWLVGDSETGKTWWALQFLAEACKNSEFDKFQMVYDDVERGNLIEVVRYFGQKLANRIGPPRGTKAKPVYSRTVEDFIYTLDDLIKKGPVIYILDSMDAIDSKAGLAKFEKGKAAHKSGEETAGSMGMDKAAKNSENMKRVVDRLDRNGSILIVISQTRENIGGYGGKRPGSGGYALRFYAHVQLWTNLEGKLKRTVLKKERIYGDLIGVTIRKNRMSGRHSHIVVPFLTDHGFDNTGASVDWLVSEKHWQYIKKEGEGYADDDAKSKIIHCPEFAFKGPREKLIQHIESKDERIRRLPAIVQMVWRQIDEATMIKRKKRYD